MIQIILNKMNCKKIIFITFVSNFVFTIHFLPLRLILIKSLFVWLGLVGFANIQNKMLNMQESTRDISVIKNRILEYTKSQNITKYKFYKDTGITRGVLDHKSGISEDNISKFLEFYENVNPHWFITGHGEMILPEGVSQSEIAKLSLLLKKSQDIQGYRKDIEGYKKNIHTLADKIEERDEQIISLNKRIESLLNDLNDCKVDKILYRDIIEQKLLKDKNK